MRKIIIILLILFIVIIIWQIYLPISFGSTEIIFRIEKGEGSREIAINLEHEGLIWWGPVFRVYVYTTGVSKNLQAGTYSLSKTMNMPNIVEKFTSGDIAKTTITIPEGFDAEQIYQKLSGITDVNLADLEAKEGYLFPDTYEIPYGISSQEIIKIMTDNFDKKTAGLEITREGIIMASIIEREVRTKEDKEQVSGLLWKRLRAGMPLQVDSAPETYERRGLPSEPICSPGLESITAAVYPKASQYWYYLSTPEGKTIFSKTLEEHNIARAKYLK